MNVNGWGCVAAFGRVNTEKWVSLSRCYYKGGSNIKIKYKCAHSKTCDSARACVRDSFISTIVKRNFKSDGRFGPLLFGFWTRWLWGRLFGCVNSSKGSQLHTITSLEVPAYPSVGMTGHRHVSFQRWKKVGWLLQCVSTVTSGVQRPPGKYRWERRSRVGIITALVWGGTGQNKLARGRFIAETGRKE